MRILSKKMVRDLDEKGEEVAESGAGKRTPGNETWLWLDEGSAESIGGRRDAAADVDLLEPLILESSQESFSITHECTQSND